MMGRIMLAGLGVWGILGELRKSNVGVVYAGCAVKLKCQQVLGDLVQIDAGNGQVFGVRSDGSIFTLYSGGWTKVPGSLMHVTVGPAGVWGTDCFTNIYKMVGGNWIKTDGMLKQIDAGGLEFIAGVTKYNTIYCLGQRATILANNGASLPFAIINGMLKYYSCGPLGCWGVGPDNSIFYRSLVTPTSCVGSGWQKVAGGLNMIEVGTRGSVYGVIDGQLYSRFGITVENPVGTSWTQLTYNSEKFRHVTEDLGNIWALTVDQRIFKCQA